LRPPRARPARARPRGRTADGLARSRGALACAPGRVAGLANKIFIKLATFPLYNYPLFINLLSSFIYIPTSFAYIIPMAMAGRFSEQERAIPQLVFITMGALDALAGIMQLFATTFIKSGSLLILLQQASIPITMAMSRLTLSAQYTRAQYAGAAVVIVGIGVILLPSFAPGMGGDDDCGSAQCSPILWSGVLVVSCVPMCMSTVYKERALAKIDCDPVYLNGWVALWQFLILLPISFPAAPFSGVAMRDVPTNLVDGWNCYVGVDTVTAAMSAASGKPVDHCWPGGLVYASLYLVFNQLYNLLIVLMLKYGSANLLYLAMTLLVPLGNIAFALPFMPQAQPLTLVNFVGLAIIMAGLFCYRFVDKILKRTRARAAAAEADIYYEVECDESDEQLQAHANRAAVMMNSPSGIFAIESLHTLLDDEIIASPLITRRIAGVAAQASMIDLAKSLLRLDLRAVGTSRGGASSALLSAND
jgi:hypothetical protein